MPFFGLLSVLSVGGIGGWLAGRLVTGYGFGVIGNIAVVITGAFLARILFPRIGVDFGGGVISGILQATLGAVLLLLLIRFFKRRSS